MKSSIIVAEHLVNLLHSEICQSTSGIIKALLNTQ